MQAKYPETEAVNVLLCGGLAGVATWVSIFPLGTLPSFKSHLPAVMLMSCPTRRDQDTCPNARSPKSPCSARKAATTPFPERV